MSGGAAGAVGRVAQIRERLRAAVRSGRHTGAHWGDVADLLTALVAAEQRATNAEQMQREWQEHLLRVHHVACDFPFRLDDPDVENLA